MSVAARVVSGSAAAWVQIAIIMVSQIALVPIYLNYWSVEIYGIWLAIQALVNFLSMLDFGHQTFLGYEFLRIGRENKRELSRYLWSGTVIGLIISLFQIGLILLFLVSDTLPHLLGETNTSDMQLLDTAAIVLILQSITYMIVVSVSGLFTRVLSPFGYYPRVAWWGVFYQAVLAIAPLGSVVLGGDLLITGITASAASILCSIPLYIDLFRLMRKERVPISRPSWKLGYKNFVLSLALSGKSLFENIRQQGTRLVLAPLAGATGLAAFSTMRTGANVALKGLNTITNPLMPDLMRFLHQRDQARSEAAFGTVWIVVIALLSPGVIILQSIIEPFYVVWTQGKISFDPSLFAVLSAGVLVYAVVQPAIAVVVGTNMLKPQLILSFVAALIVVGGSAALVPFIGILGAGISLLISEVAVSLGYIALARRWLHQNSLRWPKRAFAVAVTSVCTSAGSMALMIAFPTHRWLILILSLLILGYNLWRYWHILPSFATKRAKELLRKVPGLKLLFA